MNLQLDIVHRRLDKLRRIVKNLRELQDQKLSEIIRDEATAWAIERGLQLASEVLFDIGSHIVVSEHNASPETYEDILDQLKSSEIISSELYETLKGLGGFRNILVHDYMKLDRQKLYEYLQNRPDDFIRFTGEIEEYLEDR